MAENKKNYIDKFWAYLKSSRQSFSCFSVLLCFCTYRTGLGNHFPRGGFLKICNFMNQDAASRKTPRTPNQLSHIVRHEVCTCSFKIPISLQSISMLRQHSYLRTTLLNGIGKDLEVVLIIVNSVQRKYWVSPSSISILQQKKATSLDQHVYQNASYRCSY